MGFSDGSPSVVRDVSNAYQQFPLAWITHVADEAATFLLERYAWPCLARYWPGSREKAAGRGNAGFKRSVDIPVRRSRLSGAS